MNFWLQLAVARNIAKELQVKYCGQHYGPDDNLIIDEMLQYLWDHKSYNDDMFLIIHWDDFDCVSWVQISVENGCIQTCVPK